VFLAVRLWLQRSWWIRLVAGHRRFALVLDVPRPIRGPFGFAAYNFSYQPGWLEDVLIRQRSLTIRRQLLQLI